MLIAKFVNIRENYNDRYFHFACGDSYFCFNTTVILKNVDRSRFKDPDAPEKLLKLITLAVEGYMFANNRKFLKILKEHWKKWNGVCMDFTLIFLKTF